MQKEEKKARTLVCSSRLDIRDFAEIAEYFAKNEIAIPNKSTVLHKAISLLAQTLRAKEASISTQEAEEIVQSLNLGTKEDDKMKLAVIAQEQKESLQLVVAKEGNFTAPNIKERAAEIIQELDKTGIPKQYQTNKNEEI